MTKLIGLNMTSFDDGASKRAGVAADYLTLASKFGSPVVLAPDTKMDGLHGLILIGGRDIFPTKGDFNYFTGNHDAYQEYFDKHTLPHYTKLLDEGKLKWILMICRHAQYWAQENGCRIVRHIADEPTNSYKNYTVEQYMDYQNAKGKNKIEKIGINSRHHQGIPLIGFNHKQFKVLGTTNDSCAGYEESSVIPSQRKLVELFEERNRNILCAQYHPESMIANPTMTHFKGTKKPIRHGGELVVELINRWN